MAAKKKTEEEIPEVSPILTSDKFWVGGDEETQREMLRQESDLTEDEITELLGTLNGMIEAKFRPEVESVDWNTTTEEIEFDEHGNEIFEDEEDGGF